MVCLQYYTYSSVSWKGYILSQVALIRLLWLSCFILNSARVVISSPFDYMASLLSAFSTPLILVFPEEFIFSYFLIWICLSTSLCIYFIYMVSLPSALSTNPILVFLKGSPLDDFLFWVSSVYASCWISRSISGGYLHCLLISPFFNFQLNWVFIVFCIDYDFSLYSILTLCLC